MMVYVASVGVLVVWCLAVQVIDLTVRLRRVERKLAEAQTCGPAPSREARA